MAVKLTERAILEVKRVLDDQKMSLENHRLRVGIVGGGCSGFSYKLEFEKKEDSDALNDLLMEVDGLEVVVDRKSDLYIDGAEVDFHEGLDARGFVFNNPNAKTGCGCGQSFAV